MVGDIIDWLIKYGILPFSEYEITWPDLLAVSDQDRLLNAKEMAAINETQFRSGQGVVFEPEEMKGKAFVEGSSCLAYAIKDESKFYLVCDQEKKTKVHSQYFHKGQPIKKEDAIAQGLFMDSYFTPKKTAGRGTVSEDKNFFRLTINLENIIAITYRGQKYRIAD